MTPQARVPRDIPKWRQNGPWLVNRLQPIFSTRARGAMRKRVSVFAGSEFGWIRLCLEMEEKILFEMMVHTAVLRPAGDGERCSGSLPRKRLRHASNGMRPPPPPPHPHGTCALGPWPPVPLADRAGGEARTRTVVQMIEKMLIKKLRRQTDHNAYVGGLKEETDQYYAQLQAIELLCQTPPYDSSPHAAAILAILGRQDPMF